jgi:hypothetical protein
MHGYTSARALIAAMQAVLHNGLPFTGDNIRRALTKLNLVLPMEHLVFDKTGDPLHYRHRVVQIQKEDLVVVYPSDLSSGQPVYPMPPWDQR